MKKEKVFFGRNVDGECVLLSLALLAGLHPKELRDWVGKTAGVNFKFLVWNAFSYPMPFLGAFQEVCYALCRRFTPTLKISFNDLSSTGPLLRPKKVVFPKIPSKGQGLLLVTFYGSGHAMAYKNGKIYDCNARRPMTITAWRKKNARNLLQVRLFPMKIVRKKKKSYAHLPWMEELMARAEEVSARMKRERVL